jgi:small subunit ribosomal protein S6e
MVMRPDLPGPKRKRILVSTGVGYSPKADGMRRRKTMHGKEISPNIVQINTKVIEYGEKSIEEIIGGDKTEE